MTAELKVISGKILASNNLEDEINSTKKLGEFYSNLLRSLDINASSTSFTNISGGVALSPQHAIDCLEDGVRTSRFLKGIYKAITQALNYKTDHPLEVLYAGCGPLATLLVPILPHLDSDQFRITLIDIHEDSIASSKKIIEHLNLEDHFVDFQTCDATTYSHPKKIDLLITETMDKGLTREPQVSISEHLCQFLAPNGILIPKQISLYTGATIFGNLPSCKKSLFTANADNQIEGGALLFSINLGSSISNCGFESEPILSPKDHQANSEICIYTEIEVFDGIFLKAPEAQITDPICVIASNCIETPQYTLNYSTRPKPTWTVKQKNGTD